MMNQVLINLVVNGESRSVSGVATLEELVESMGLKADRVAVELNREIIQRAQWQQTALREGDRLEIVHFVGGG